MNISDKGINLLKQLEGCVKNGNRHIIYDDKTGRPVQPSKALPRGASIGYGHLIRSHEDFKNGISESAATELLRADIMVAQRAVQNSITVPLSQNQYDALVMLAYNIGEQNFANSTVVKYLNDPNFHSAQYPTLESAWRAWNKSCGCKVPGLVNRRAQEWRLFNNDI